MRTIIIKNESDLIPLGGRSVSTWDSGLLRVEEKYVGLTTMELTHRALFKVGNPPPSGDNSPSFDGITISSQPNEVRREDGFTEYSVTYHGRVDNAGLGDPTSPESMSQEASLIYNEGNVADIPFSAFTPRTKTIVKNKDVGRALEFPEDWDFNPKPFDPDDLGTRFVVRQFENVDIIGNGFRYLIRDRRTIVFGKSTFFGNLNFVGFNVLYAAPESNFSRVGLVDELTVSWKLKRSGLSGHNFSLSVVDAQGNTIDSTDKMFP